MRAVLVTAPSYDDLKLIHTLRRLYQRASAAYTVKVELTWRMVSMAF